MDERKLKLRENEFNTDRIKLNENSFKIENEYQCNTKKYFSTKSAVLNTYEPINILNPKIKEKIYKYYINNKKIESYDFSEEDRKTFLYFKFFFFEILYYYQYH